MPALRLRETMVAKDLAQEVVIRATTVSTVGSALPRKLRRNLLLVVLVGRVPIVMEAGSVLLDKPLCVRVLARRPLVLLTQEILSQANQVLLLQKKSQVGNIVVVGKTI